MRTAKLRYEIQVRGGISFDWHIIMTIWQSWRDFRTRYSLACIIDEHINLDSAMEMTIYKMLFVKSTKLQSCKVVIVSTKGTSRICSNFLLHSYVYDQF